MPRGARRNLRPVVTSASQPISPTSTGSWPTDWVASSRYGTPAARANAPIEATGSTRPEEVGTWVAARSAAGSRSAASSAPRSSCPSASSGTISTVAPSRSSSSSCSAELT